MHMVGYGTFAQAWESCFSPYQPPDPIQQQIAELSTLVGYGLRGPGMGADEEELSNLDHGDMSVIVYYQIGNYFYPLVVRSVMDGVQGSLNETIVTFLVGAQCVPTVEDLVSHGLWPLYSPQQ